MTTIPASVPDDLVRFAVLPLATALPEAQSSVELSRNSKGASWSVKVFHSDPDAALATACRPYDDVAQRYGDGREA